MLSLVKCVFQHPKLKMILFGLFHEVVGGAVEHLQMTSNWDFRVSAGGSLQKCAEGVRPFTPPQNKTVGLNNQLYGQSRHYEETANKAKRKMFSYLRWFGTVLSHRFLCTSSNRAGG